MVGVGVQRLFPLLIARYFQFTDTVPWSSAFAGEGLLVGLLVTLLFTLPPLLSVRKVRPLLILRRDMAEVKLPWVKRLRGAVPSMLAGALMLAGWRRWPAWLAESPRMGATFVAGLAVALLLLAGVAWAAAVGAAGAGAARAADLAGSAAARRRRTYTARGIMPDRCWWRWASG